MTTLELCLLLLLGAVAAVVLFRVLRLPPMLGYLTLGILVGPHALDVTGDPAATAALAEFGVVFLMFSIGLEFNLGTLWSMRSTVFGLGVAQVGATLLAAVVGGWVAGLLAAPLKLGWLAHPWTTWFALGGALAMSSTAIVVKLLADRLELESEHGRRIVGVLLSQDLAVVLLLIIVPALSGPREELALTLAWAVVKGALVLAVLLGLGQPLMRAWLHIVARQRSSELFMINLLLTTLGLAWVTQRAGLSLALGAFIAGMLIAETEYRHQVEEDIKPFRDVLLGLFFITVGMLFDGQTVLAHWTAVAALVAALLVFKFVTVTALARWFGASPGVALRIGLSLAQAGEFGFVLLQQAAGLKLVDPILTQAVLAAMVLSMLAAPFLIQFSERIVLKLAAGEWMRESVALTQIAARGFAVARHVIVCGYGRSGQGLARLLERSSISYLALDLDPDRVREAAAAGDNVVYGDAGRREYLVAAGIHRAAAVVVTTTDTGAALRVLHQARALAPRVPVIVRTADDSELERLRAAGAAEVVPETMEGSLMLASQALVLLGVPIARVVRLVRDVREERYRLLRGFFHGASDEADGGESSEVRLHSVTIEDAAWARGRRLDEAHLERLDVEIVALRRHGVRGADPDPETMLEAGDSLVLRGTGEAVARAEAALRSPHFWQRSAPVETAVTRTEVP